MPLAKHDIQPLNFKDELIDIEETSSQTPNSKFRMVKTVRTKTKELETSRSPEIQRDVSQKSVKIYHKTETFELEKSKNLNKSYTEVFNFDMPEVTSAQQQVRQVAAAAEVSKNVLKLASDRPISVKIYKQVVQLAAPPARKSDNAASSTFALNINSLDDNALEAQNRENYLVKKNVKSGALNASRVLNKSTEDASKVKSYQRNATQIVEETSITKSGVRSQSPFKKDLNAVFTKQTITNERNSYEKSDLRFPKTALPPSAGGNQNHLGLAKLKILDEHNFNADFSQSSYTKRNDVSFKKEHDLSKINKTIYEAKDKIEEYSEANNNIRYQLEDLERILREKRFQLEELEKIIQNIFRSNCPYQYCIRVKLMIAKLMREKLAIETEIQVLQLKRESYLFHRKIINENFKKVNNYIKFA